MSNNKISQIKLPNNNEIYDIEGRNIQRISWSDYSNLSEEDKKSNTAYYITNIPLDEGGYKHEEGSVISIDDGKLNEPLKACTVDINPVQSGSGTPSPSNIRPISGWTEANITVASANVWDEEWEVGVYNSSSDTVIKAVDTTHIRSKNPIRVDEGRTYYFNSASNNVHLIIADESGNVLYRTTSLNNGTFTVPTNGKYAYFNMAFVYGTTYNNDISINYPSTDTEYHAYNGHTYIINLNGTRYGGTLDVVSGVLTVTDGYIASYNGETLPSTWISDRDVYAEGTTPTTGAEVVYKLATPTEVSLTPTEITTLYGNNVIWADSGDMAITYTYESNNQIRMGDEIFSVGSNAQTISGHTVLTDVPADAVFTDTTYSVTPVTISTAQKGSDITVDDITAWNAGSVTTVTYNETTHSIIINNGVLPSLSYTAKNVPNITTENIQVVKDVSVVNSNITDG